MKMQRSPKLTSPLRHPNLLFYTLHNADTKKVTQSLFYYQTVILSYIRSFVKSIVNANQYQIVFIVGHIFLPMIANRMLHPQQIIFQTFDFAWSVRITLKSPKEWPEWKWNVVAISVSGSFGLILPEAFHDFYSCFRKEIKVLLGILKGCSQ